MPAQPKNPPGSISHAAVTRLRRTCRPHGICQLVPFAFSFQGMPFAVPGRYLVQLTLDDDPVRGVPFTVHVEQVPTFRGPAAAGPV